MPVPFLDLKAQHRELRDELMQVIGESLDNAQFILGPQVEAFENEFAEFCGADHAVAVNSGTSALHLALLGCGIGEGDEVITVANTFVATIEPILYVGARPVFVDIDPHSYNIDISRIEDAITPRTKAILPVHLYGQPTVMQPVMEIARRHGLAVIEDACQAHGAEIDGRRAGSVGNVGCFSFYPGKNLGACGEAGMAVTSNSEIATKMRSLRDHGQTRKHCHDDIGFNYRMAGIQGAILRVKLRHLPEWTQARRRVAGIYRELLSESDVVRPAESEDVRHVYHLYVVRTPRRDALMQHLKENGISCGLHYPVPVHLQKGYRGLNCGHGSLTETERHAMEVLSLPVYPEMPVEAVKEVAQQTCSFKP